MSGGYAQWTERQIREIIREELRSRTERLTWDGATIREIVREEMENEKLVAMTEKAQRDCYEQIKPKWLDDEMLAKITDAPKPKTDLEKAAEIVDKELSAYQSMPMATGESVEYRNGYLNACRSIWRRIWAIKSDS